MKTTTESFVNQFIAVVKGDNAKADAEKTFRQVKSALQSKIHSMEGDTVDKEQEVKDADDKLSKARIHGGKTIDGRNGRDSYITDLVKAYNAIQDKNEALTQHKATITFLKKELKNLV